MAHSNSKEVFTPPAETGEGIKEISGAELRDIKNKSVVGIGIVDVPRFKAYFDQGGIHYEFYRYKSDPENGILLLFNSALAHTELYADLREPDFEALHGKLEGGFESHVLVDKEIVLQKVE